MSIAAPKAQFVLSAGHLGELPALSEAEFCVLGRSNVGKSSFVNHVLADGKLARVSKQPGRTVCANLYRLTNGTYWTDLPGYGYARSSGAEAQRISELVSDYCAKRANLRGIIWLLDVRHPGMRADHEAAGWFSTLVRPVFTVLTKCDKLSRSQTACREAEFRKLFPGITGLVRYTAAGEGPRSDFWKAFAAWTEAIGSQKP